MHPESSKAYLFSISFSTTTYTPVGDYIYITCVMALVQDLG